MRTACWSPSRRSAVRLTVAVPQSSWSRHPYFHGPKCKCSNAADVDAPQASRPVERRKPSAHSGGKWVVPEAAEVSGEKEPSVREAVKEEEGIRAGCATKPRTARVSAAA